MILTSFPDALAAFCAELNCRRNAIDAGDAAAVYELSFWAHYELVTIHPWADGNGRTCRLLMNLIQMEFGVLPVKVLKEDKEEYIQALIETREKDDVDIFINLMAELPYRLLLEQRCANLLVRDFRLSAFLCVFLEILTFALS